MDNPQLAWRERLQEERRQHILEAAARVFARKGFERATMKEIAAEAGISPGTIYLYFKNKKDLLVNLPSLIGEPVLAEVTGEMSRLQIGDRSPDLEPLLQQLVRSGIQRLVQNADVFRVLVSAIPVMDEETREAYLRRTPLSMAGVLEQMIQAQIEQEVFRPMNPAIVARALVGMVVSFVMLQEILLGQRVTPFDYDEVAQEITRLFLYGALLRSKVS
ncbi:MAG TPA: TetR/AcrR family transcriptional regulator [Anaerolineae bacterium]|nr:TetR/AcrR family transcriptional regulator [Anaerolineae bacterium]HIQ06807.1 TetR/AcrR family transcriptional regulator [Anaerolineae bacterium]